MKVGVVEIADINTEAGRPLLVERTQRPKPTSAAAPQADAVRSDDVLEWAFALQRCCVDGANTGSGAHRTATAGAAALARLAARAAPSDLPG